MQHRSNSLIRALLYLYIKELYQNFLSSKSLSRHIVFLILLFRAKPFYFPHRYYYHNRKHFKICPS